LSVLQIVKAGAMQLVCEKYKEEVVVCGHPREYCKFRSACLIHFLNAEKNEQREADGGEQNRATKVTPRLKR
jgi:hypothetical protein